MFVKIYNESQKHTSVFKRCKDHFYDRNKVKEDEEKIEEGQEKEQE